MIEGQDYEQPKTLAECKRLYNDLIQIDPNAFSGTPEHEENDLFLQEQNANNNSEAESLDKQSEIAMLERLNLLNDEFQRLSNITEENGENIIFREQQLGPALKRRAVAVHNAKVPRFNPNNGSDIRKMLESQRKPLRDLLEKEFDKRGQFKFALCSLLKFIVDKKPGDNEEVDKKNSTRRDWLRNKQIIVYNRAEIDDYLSNAFEQIIYQVEERGGKSNS
ncbi:5995_t:CDS:2 [Entrophospora sp. SA101]|nr:5990_t:CDS:2 [Entrophospora sp. SA101]CAJ0647432.1 5995_t:CDS:2 [Entrophospora sp. SA101]